VWPSAFRFLENRDEGNFFGSAFAGGALSYESPCFNEAARGSGGIGVSGGIDG
jgi:hypothetical protein